MSKIYYLALLDGISYISTKLAKTDRGWVFKDYYRIIYILNYFKEALMFVGCYYANGIICLIKQIRVKFTGYFKQGYLN